jgi:hypothetical protein
MPGLDVVLKSRDDGPLTCSAIVTAVDGAYSERLVREPEPGCRFVGAFGRMGSYVVIALVAGFEMAAIDGVVVAGKGCEIDPRLLTIMLAKQGTDPSAQIGVEAPIIDRTARSGIAATVVSGMFPTSAFRLTGSLLFSRGECG